MESIFWTSVITLFVIYVVYGPAMWMYIQWKRFSGE